MKKILCILLSVLMLVTALAMVSCDKTPDDDSNKESESQGAAALKFGLGVYTSAPTATSATADVNGQGAIDVTAAVLTVDADGKVVACQLDTMEIIVDYTKEGKAIANDGFKTKYERGADYNMVAWGGAETEWFEQTDAFETVVVGKTLNQIKALVAEGNKGTSDVTSAGCTIKINEFVGAIEKAFANLADSTATASSALKLGMATAQETTDATADVDGINSVETTIFAAATDAEGKVLVADTDCVAVEFTFNTAGASTFDTTKAVVSKRELGFDYGMVAYSNGQVEKEWFEQADAFNTVCVGKTASEIVALCVEGAYGTDAVKTAGCTMKVDGFTKAAAKIG